MPEEPREFWSTDGHFGARLEGAALRAILDWCRKSGKSETGGILVGRYSDDRRLATITAASAPPSDSRAGHSWLLRGVRGLHSWLERLWKDEAGYYVGEWHFHPFSPATPSRQDIAQMKRIAKSESYQCAEPILLVIGGNPAGAWTMRLEVHSRAGNRHELSMQTNHTTRDVVIDVKP